MILILAALALLIATPHAIAGTGHVWTATNKVPGEYIVVLSDQSTGIVDDVVGHLLAKHGGTLLGTLRVGAKGYGVRMTPAQATRVSANPLVAHVEENSYALLSSFQALPFGNNSYWHLDRSDTHEVFPYALNHFYNYSSTGAGVYAYVLDTGVLATHNEFGGRVLTGANFGGDGYTADNPCGGFFSASSNPAHGTAVASIIAGALNGVAKGVTVVPVKVWGCNPNSNPYTNAYIFSTSLAWCYGTSWILSDACPNGGACRPAVVNISGFLDVAQTGGELCDGVNCLSAFEFNIQQLLSRGIPVVTSANNFGSGDCSVYTPSRMGGTYMNLSNHTITVGGTTEAANGPEARWSGSNYGNCVDIYAPAVNYQHLATLASNTGEQTDPYFMSGTSYSCALVTGAVARILQSHPGLGPAAIRDYLNLQSTRVTCFDNSTPCNDKLLYAAPGD